MIKKLLFLTLSILFNFNTFSQTTKTVKTDLSDFQSLVNGAVAGDQIVIPNGTYNNDFYIVVNNSGTNNNEIHIKAQTQGGVTFTGKIGFQLNGNRIKISGFNFENATVSSSSNQSIANEPTVVAVMGSNNILENIKFYKIKQHNDKPVRYVMFRNQNAKNNLITRCTFEKGTEHSIMIIGYINTTATPTANIVEYCYFKGTTRHASNGNSAIRFGTGEKSYDPIGGNIIRYNLFDQYNGEEETISLKSSDNIIEHNTFLNCFGQVNARHYHRNTIRHNYFIQEGVNKPTKGGSVGIWGEDHVVANNYFYGVRSRDNDSGTIEITAGNSNDRQSKHEQVENAVIENNIIYAPYVNDAAISFSARAYVATSGNVDQTGAFINHRQHHPLNTTVKNNYIFSTETNPDKLIDYNSYATTANQVTYTGNKINKATGDSGIATSNVAYSSSTINGYTIYKPQSTTGIGPSSSPLATSQTGANSALVNINVTAVNIPNASYDVPNGENISLTGTISPSNATNQTLIWSSSNPSVASVNASTGTVTAVTMGQVTITAKSDENNSINDTCIVNVVSVAVTSVDVTPATITLQPNDTQTLNVTVLPANATDKNITWTSTDNNIAIVNSSGLVTALAVGNVTIKATSDDNGSIYDETIISVVNQLQNVALNRSVVVSSEQNDPANSNVNLGIHCIDDNISSRWAASGFPQNIVIDLGSVKDISKTEMVCWNDRAYQFEISTKVNIGDAFTPLVDANSNTTPGSETAPITNNFSATNARYVKLTVNGVGLGVTSQWVNIKEFRVFGVDTSMSNKINPLEKVTISPNPFKDEININLNGISGDKKIVIYSLIGKVVYQQTTKSIDRISLTPSYNNVSQGIYFLKIIGENSSRTVKLIRE